MAKREKGEEERKRARGGERERKEVSECAQSSRRRLEGETRRRHLENPLAQRRRAEQSTYARSRLYPTGNDSRSVQLAYYMYARARRV